MITVCCGAECGIAVTGLGTVQDRHWGGVLGVPAIETSTVRTGGKSFSIPAAGGGFASLQRSLAATRTVAYFRGYFRLSTATPAAITQLVIVPCTGGTSITFEITTAGVLRTGGWSVVTGPTLVANTWYGLELEVDITVSPSVARWRFWDGSSWSSMTDSTKTHSATAIPTVYFGAWGPTSGITTFWDDILIGEGTTPGEDYDVANSKGGIVKIYRPNADGTHSFTAADFGYDGAGADVGVGDTTVYQRLDESSQIDITDFIRQKVIRTTGYIELQFEDEATLTPRVVAVTSTHHSSSTGANQHSLKASDDAFTSTTTLLTNDDISDTTAHYRHKTMTTKPSSGAWTNGALNSTRVRWGYSGDVTDIPYIDNASLEVAYTDIPVVGSGFDPMGAAGFFGL